jgi:hypothetical protein
LRASGLCINMKNPYKHYIVALLLLCLMMPSVGMTQERSAMVEQNANLTWSQLYDQVDNLNALAKDSHNKLDRISICSSKQKLYSPTSGNVDADGCIGFSNLDSYISCAQNKQIFNGTACIAPPAPAAGIRNCTISTVLAPPNTAGSWCSTGGCPSGYVHTGMAADGSNGCQTPSYCTRLVCS